MKIIVYIMCVFVGLIIKNKSFIKGHGINKLKITSRQQN